VSMNGLSSMAAAFVGFERLSRGPSLRRFVRCEQPVKRQQRSAEYGGNR